MQVTARFYSLTGEFTVTKVEKFTSTDEALNAARIYAQGFSNFKIVEDYSIRITATPRS